MFLVCQIGICPRHHCFFWGVGGGWVQKLLGMFMHFEGIKGGWKRSSIAKMGSMCSEQLQISTGMSLLEKSHQGVNPRECRVASLQNLHTHTPTLTHGARSPNFLWANVCRAIPRCWMFNLIGGKVCVPWLRLCHEDFSSSKSLEYREHGGFQNSELL